MFLLGLVLNSGLKDPFFDVLLVVPREVSNVFTIELGACLAEVDHIFLNYIWCFRLSASNEFIVNREFYIVKSCNLP